MFHVLFFHEHSASEADGIRKDARSFGITFEHVSKVPIDGVDNVIEERVLEMKDHPAHRLINRYLSKTNKIQQSK